MFMQEETNRPNPPPNGDDAAVRTVIWLLAAFAPSLIGIACLSIINSGQWLIWLLGTTNLIFSVAASIGLVRGIRYRDTRFLVCLVLVPFFFFLNVLIVIFVGCSGMGRISP
jgi:hypothetical protein